MSQNIILQEQYGLRRTVGGYETAYRGEVEFLIKDRNGQVINQYREPNLIKIFAKEMLAHRLPFSKVWDPNAGTGSGAWVASSIDPGEEFAAKYILFGASFDSEGNPLDASDTRFYMVDPASGASVPIRLGVGAEFSGGLINAIPISEPLRPLKRVERIFFEPSYQPAGTPLLQEDVRAMNNVVVLETTLPKEEYNGFGVTASDFFTITEVALVGGRELGLTGACECNPHDLFLEGSGNDAILAHATGAATISIDPSELAFVDVIKEGDQVKIVAAGSTAAATNILNQVTPFYLVINKAVGGSDITLDRTPVDVDNNPVVGDIGIFRDTLRLFSHRILSVPVKKSVDFSVTVRWRITMA